MDLAAEGEAPKALLDKPELGSGLRLFYDAFWALSTDRPLMMGGVGHIPFASIDLYARRAGIDGRDEFERFRILIGRMDEAYLSHTAKQREDNGET